jgi:WD40 repeat protein
LTMEFTVNSITPSRDGNFLAFSDEYSQVSIYSLAANEHQIAYQIQDPLGQVIFNADGTQVMAAGQGGAAQTPGILRVWSLATSERIASPQFNASMRRLALHPDGNLLVIDASTKLLFLDAHTFEQTGELELPLLSKAVAFTPDGQLLVTHVDGTVRVWDIQADTDEIVLDYTGADNGDRAAISPDGHLLAISQNRSREILLWDTTTREIVGRFSDDIGALSFLAFDPSDGTLHFTISNRRYSWTPEEDEPLQITDGFTPDSMDYDALVDTAQTYYPFGRGVNIRQAVPIPNTTLLMVNDGTSLTAWDMNTRLPASSVRFYGDILGFSADGTVMLTRTQGAFWLWSISP